MANSIGKAALILGTRSQGLKSGLDGAFNKVNGWKSKITSIFQTGFAGILGGKLGTEALSTATDLAASGDMAKSIGASTAQFMGLKKAAELAGVDVKSLMEGLIDMSGRAAEAMKGGQFAEMFKQLQLDPAAVNAMNADEKFWAMAEALGKVSNASDRARMTLKIFGEDVGKQLLPVMARGADKLRAFVEEQKRIGVALSEADMAKVQKLRDTIPRVGAVFEGAWNKMVVAMAPALTMLAERFASIWAKAQPFVDALVAGFKVFWDVAGGALAELFAWFGRISESVMNFFSGMNATGSAAETVKSIVVSILKNLTLGGLIIYEAWKMQLTPVVGIWGLILQALDGVKNEVVEILKVMKWLNPMAWGFHKEIDKALDSLVKKDWAATGREMTKWAVDQVTLKNATDNWKSIDQFFENILKKKEEVAKPVDPFTPLANNAIQATKTLQEAIYRNSTQDYSLRMRWEFGGAANVQQQQLQEQRNGNKINAENGKKLEAIKNGMKPVGTI